MKPPWHGGNKIPASYLKRFLPSQGKPTHEGISYDLQIFIDQLGSHHVQQEPGED